MNTNRLPFLGVLSLALVLAACIQHSELGDTKHSTISQVSSSSAGTASSISSRETSSAEASSVSSKDAPKEIVLPMPFAVQAPLGNWDAMHEEACEEMSIIMVDHALKGTALSPQTAESELQALITWEEKHGYKVDITIEQVATIAQTYFGISGHVDADVTEAHMADLLKNGHMLIIPAAGRKLGNPYFSGEGPWYHMLVIKGWKKGIFSNSFIANDPGTKHGEGYVYSADVLISAIHNWVGVNEKIETGPKAIFVVDKKNF